MPPELILLLKLPIIVRKRNTGLKLVDALLSKQTLDHLLARVGVISMLTKEHSVSLGRRRTYHFIFPCTKT